MDAAKKLQALARENKLLFNDIDTIYRRIGVLQTGRTQDKLLDASQKKIKELNRRLQISEARIEYLRRTIELERERNFEDELIKLLDEYSENRIDERTLLRELTRFRDHRAMMLSGLDERNKDALIEIFTRDGDEVLEKALDGEGFCGPLRADIYNSIYEKLRPTRLETACEYARRAWEADPSPARVIALALCYRDLGDPARAAALIELLPGDYEFSEEEGLIADSIRRAAFL